MGLLRALVSTKVAWSGDLQFEADTEADGGLMIYRPKDVPPEQPIPYGGSKPEFPFGRDSTAVVFPDDGSGSWGFFDPYWVEDGRVRGQLRINIASPTGHGGTGAEHQTVTFWAAADAPDQIVDRIQAAIKFALEEGARQERRRIAAALINQV